MVPNVADRGHSFKGAAAYLMHDKNAQTSERVAWTSTHNLHTDNVEKAARFMAWTDLNREALRDEGASKAGRSATAGNVYHYSLAWKDGQEPSREHMEQTAHASIERLGLEKHQYFLVAHQDEEHKHVHVVVNLVNPETGKIANVYRDRYRLDRWANEYEKEHGIVCDNRAAKYQALEQGEPAYKSPSEQKKLAREGHEKNAKLAFETSDSGKAFAASLQDKGLTLARGNQRGFVVVDGRGNVYALGGMIEGAKTKDINAKLKDVDREALPIADHLIQERTQARAQGLAEELPETAQPILKPVEVDETPAAPVAPPTAEKQPEAKPEPQEDVYFKFIDTDEKPAAPIAQPAEETKPEKQEEAPRPVNRWAHFNALEAERVKTAQASEWNEARETKIQEAKAFYQVDQKRQEYQQAKTKAESMGFWARVTGRKAEALQDADALRKNLENAEMRLAEQIRTIEQSRPEWAKRQELERQELGQGGKLQSEQERERVEAEQTQAEKDNAALQEAEASPKKAAELAPVVTAKSAAQRGRVAAVQARAREHEAERVAEVKTQEKAQENTERLQEKTTKDRSAAFAKAAANRAKTLEEHKEELRAHFFKGSEQQPPEIKGEQIEESKPYKAQRDMSPEELEAHKAELMEQYKAEFARQAQEQDLGQEQGRDQDHGIDYD